MDTLSYLSSEGNDTSIAIPLTNGTFAYVSSEDIDLAAMAWSSNGRYASTSIRTNKKRTILMHRLILERKLGRPIGPKMTVDHINNNPLDNRRSNLREATQSQNHANREQKVSASGFRGVHFWPITHKWVARIQCNGVPKTLGYFDTPEEASWHYDKAAFEMYGEFARLNHPLEQVQAWNPPPKIRTTSKSGWRGVRKFNSKWGARIGAHGGFEYIGVFDTPEEAAKAYDRVAIKRYGDRAITNFPKEIYDEMQHEKELEAG